MVGKKMLIVMILTLMKYYDEQSIYLIYIYHSFILNVFLTFFTFLTFIFVVIRFKLVLGHLCQRIEELYMTVTLTCWRAKYGKTVQRIFTSWFGTYFIYICFFFIWCKCQEALCKLLPCFAFLSGCSDSSDKHWK